MLASAWDRFLQVSKPALLAMQDSTDVGGGADGIIDGVGGEV